MSFDSLGLSAALLRGVADQGYTEPTPIQANVIPVVLAGRDVMAGAQTGTGKTAGFTLPMLQLLSTAAPAQGPRRVRALILTPTRELAAQVGESVRNYGKYTSTKSAIIFGGVSINPQIAELRRGVDVLIATPGRLLDHAEQRTVDLSHVEIFVLDEADRMLDMGFLPDIKRVLARLPQKRQNLLFSATFPDDIRKLANKLLDKPAEIEVARRNVTAERIEQIVHRVEKRDKRDVLSWLISSGNWRQVLVFTRTKHGANRLAEQLEQDGLRSAAIHGNKSQGARTRALAEFKDGTVQVLVATDLASRGIDIDQLPHVVNYELPEVPEYYVHRIGRTGRAGNEGVATSLVSNDERQLLRQIEKLTNQQIPEQPLDGFHSRPAPQRAPEAPRGNGDQRPQHRDGDRPRFGDQRRDGQRRGGEQRPRHGHSHGGGHGNGGGGRSHGGHGGGNSPQSQGGQRNGNGAPNGEAQARGNNGAPNGQAQARGNDGERPRQHNGPRPAGKSRAARRRNGAARASGG